jgi:hypothetical protein
MVLNILGEDVVILQRVTAEIAHRQAEQSAETGRSEAGSTRIGLPWNTRRHRGERRPMRKSSISRVAGHSHSCARLAAARSTRQRSRAPTRM